MQTAPSSCDSTIFITVAKRNSNYRGPCFIIFSKVEYVQLSDRAQFVSTVCLSDRVNRTAIWNHLIRHHDSYVPLLSSYPHH